MKIQKLGLLVLLAIFGCQLGSNSDLQKSKNLNEPFSQKVKDHFPKRSYPEFDRIKILKNLSKKIDKNEPLVAHIFVPLCDNENQGIVPVSKSLGDGQNLRTNLYWGARHGLKTHFKKLADWRLIYSKKDISQNILERVVFEKTFHNGAIIKLVLDAYSGDKMRACLEDYFLSLAGRKQNIIEFESQKIGIHGSADLIGFNGHNGLMDVEVDPVENIDNLQKDAVVIGCISYNYFKNHLKAGGGFPLLMTTNLMAPEAYVLAGALDAWANLKNEKEVREAAAKGYNLYQKCGINGARNLFKSGW